jgi:hypothetical protein
MSDQAHRRMARSLAACSCLHTRSASPTAPWGALPGRWHSLSTTAATALRNRRAGAAYNCAKLRARLRPSVRFTAAADTGPSVRGSTKPDTEQNVVRI